MIIRDKVKVTFAVNLNTLLQVKQVIMIKSNIHSLSLQSNMPWFKMVLPQMVKKINSQKRPHFT